MTALRSHIDSSAEVFRRNTAAFDEKRQVIARARAAAIMRRGRALALNATPSAAS